MSFIITTLGPWLIGTKIGRYVLIGMIFSLMVAYVLLSTYKKGQQSEILKQKAREAEALKRALESDAEVDKMSRNDRRRYLNQWVR